MMKRTFVFSLAIILVLTITSAVFADAHIPACTGEAATGTVVDFNEEKGIVTIAYDPEGDEDIALCTVTFPQDADYGHPITTLLGNYFEEFMGTYDPDALQEAKAAFDEATLVCVLEDDDTGTDATYVMADVQEPCAETEANLLGSDGTGTFTLLLGDGTFGTLVVVEIPEVAETVCVVEDDDTGTDATYVLSDADPCEGEGIFAATVTEDLGEGQYAIEVTIDASTTSPGTLVLPEFETLTGLEDAVAGLVDNFFSALSADGVAWAVGDDIAEKHDDGFGFGVIVKLYSIFGDACFDEEGKPIEGCEVTLDDLFAAFEGGTGMGHLFKEYGKPSKLGVGHVRQDNGGSPGASGLCNENAAPDSAAGCGSEDGKSANPNSNKDKTKTNKGKNNKGD